MPTLFLLNLREAWRDLVEGETFPEDELPRDLNVARDAYAATDILRLFYGAATPRAGGLCLEIGEAEPYYLLVALPCALLPEPGAAPDAGPRAELRQIVQPTVGEVLRMQALSLGSAGELRRLCDSLRDAFTDVRKSVFVHGVALAQNVALAEQRRALKRCLYFVLSERSGERFAWGALTGIRPQLMALQRLRRAYTDEAVLRALEQEDFVSPHKARLALQLARREMELGRQIPQGSVSVYIHIPFCPSRCAYCSFTPLEGIAASRELQDRYAAAVADQIARVLPAVLGSPDPSDSEESKVLKEFGSPFSPTRENRVIRYVYIGGGTPSALDAPLLRRIFERLMPFLDTSRGLREWTLEVGRADCLQEGHLQLFQDYPIRHACLNPQTFRQETLRRMGREMSEGSFESALAKLRATGLPCINMDLIAGLPGESCEDFRRTLERTIELGADAVTIHSLAVKRGSNFDRNLRGAAASSASDAVTGDARQLWARLHRAAPDVCQMFDAGEDQLLREGYKPYYLYRNKDGLGGLENLSYAREGAESFYNIAMMTDCTDVIAFGAGAMNKRIDGDHCARLANKRAISDFIRDLDQQIEKQIAFFDRSGIR